MTDREMACPSASPAGHPVLLLRGVAEKPTSASAQKNLAALAHPN